MKEKLLIDCIDITGSSCKPFEGSKRYVSTGAVAIDHIDKNATEIVDYTTRPSRADLIVEPGALLFAKMKGTKKTLYIDKKLSENIYSTGFYALKAKEGILNDRCLYHLLGSTQFLAQKDKYCSGATQKAITNVGLKKIRISVPDYPLQEVIAEQLDRISSIIKMRRLELQKLDELVKARFVEMFGDYDLTHPHESWTFIKKIGTVVGGATPKTDHDEYWGGSYRWITPAELDADSGYIYDSVRKLTKEGVESCSLQKLPVGTVILSSRAPIGKVAIAGNTFYCNQGFKNIICKEGIVPQYLYTILQLNVEYLKSLGRGATFKEISKEIVENIRIPTPPIALQEQFAAFVEQTDKSKFAVQQALDNVQLLFDSLIQEYFG